MRDAEGNEYIKLDQFLKLAQVVETGGEAKHLILSGHVRVNGTIETRRGRKLRDGDVVQIGEDEIVVQVDDEEAAG
jgi:ribosome-associated protein